MFGNAGWEVVFMVDNINEFNVDEEFGALNCPLEAFGAIRVNILYIYYAKIINIVRYFVENKKRRIRGELDSESDGILNKERSGNESYYQEI